MKVGAKAFSLTDANEQVLYEEFVNRDGIKVIGKTDSLTKEGDAIRVVDYRERDGRVPVYRPPIC